MSPTENCDITDPDSAFSERKSNMKTYAANLYPNLVQKEHDFIEDILIGAMYTRFNVDVM